MSPRAVPLGMTIMIALAVVAFTPCYFSDLPNVPWYFHYHGITATIWMILLALQGWLIKAGRRGLHRTIGIAGLAFFPFFLAGTVAVVLSMARAASTDPFYRIYGPRLGVMDATSPVIIAWLYYRAIADRRTIPLHARYLIAIVLFLIMPIASRLLDHLVPGLRMHGPADFPRFDTTMRIANAIAPLCALALYATAPRYGRPFLVAGAVLLIQAIAFETVGGAAAWRMLFDALRDVPVWAALVATACATAALSRIGWMRGRASPRRTRVAMALPGGARGRHGHARAMPPDGGITPAGDGHAGTRDNPKLLY